MGAELHIGVEGELGHGHAAGAGQIERFVGRATFDLAAGVGERDLLAADRAGGEVPRCDATAAQQVIGRGGDQRVGHRRKRHARQLGIVVDRDTDMGGGGAGEHLCRDRLVLAERQRERPSGHRHGYEHLAVHCGTLGVAVQRDREPVFAIGDNATAGGAQRALDRELTGAGS